MRSGSKQLKSDREGRGGGDRHHALSPDRPRTAGPELWLAAHAHCAFCLRLGPKTLKNRNKSPPISYLQRIAVFPDVRVQPGRDPGVKAPLDGPSLGNPGVILTTWR